MKRKTYIAAIVAAFLGAVSCVEGLDPSLKDNRFEISASVSYDMDRLGYDLVLSLSSGDGGDFSLSVKADGAPVSLANEGMVSISSQKQVHLALPSFGTGNHDLSVVLSRAGVERKGSVTFEEKDPVTAVLSTEGESTILHLTSTGIAGACSISLELDGKTLEGAMRNGTVIDGDLQVDLRLVPEISMTLPESVTSGTHILSVVVSASAGSRTVSASFEQPFRNEVSVRTVFLNEYLRNSVEIFLLSGRDASYVVTYSVDGDPSLVLEDTNGAAFPSGSSLDISKTEKMTLFLPDGSNGEHEVTMSFSYEGNVSEHSFSYVTAPLLGAAVDVAGDVTVLELFSDGRLGACSLSFSLDGSQTSDLFANGAPVAMPYPYDFGNGTCVFTFSDALPAGSHSITVTAQTSRSSVTVTTTFTEPLRAEFDASISYSPYYMRHILELSMTAGKSAEYAVSCIVDNDTSLSLTTENGERLGSSFTEEFTAGNRVVYLLPAFESGKHEARLEVSCNGTTFSWSFPWSVSFLASVSVGSTQCPDPQVSITGLVATSHSYTLSFRLDGSPCTVYNGSVSLGSTFESLIGEGTTKTYGLKGLKLGNHILEVTISSERGSETQKVEFSCTRPGPLKLVFGFDDYEKKITLTCPNNLYNEEIVIGMEETVTGCLKFIHTTWLQTWGAEIVTQNYKDIQRRDPITIIPSSKAVVLTNSYLWNMMDSMHLDHHATHQYRGSTFRDEFYADLDHVSLTISFSVGSGAPADGIPVIVDFQWKDIYYPYSRLTWNNSTSPEKATNEIKGISFHQYVDVTFSVPARHWEQRAYHYLLLPYIVPFTIK